MCQSSFFKTAGLRPTTLFKETLAQVFSYEFCEVFLEQTWEIECE